VSKVNGNELLIFLHIPKTGGTTLTKVIEQQYQNNFHYEKGDLSKLKMDLERAETILGHLPFGAHRYVSKKCTYITMLREPVEHVTSWFYYRYKSPYFDPYDGSFEDYLNDDIFNLTYSNLQTRFICGDDPPSFEKAKMILTTYFSVVGITELFAESLFFMKKKFHWQEVFVEKSNVNRNRPLREHLPKSTIEIICKKNEIDLKVYNFAKNKLLKKIAGLDDQTKRELNQFKRNFASI